MRQTGFLIAIVIFLIYMTFINAVFGLFGCKDPKDQIINSQRKLNIEKQVKKAAQERKELDRRSKYRRRREKIERKKEIQEIAKILGSHTKDCEREEDIVECTRCCHRLGGYDIKNYRDLGYGCICKFMADEWYIVNGTLENNGVAIFSVPKIDYGGRSETKHIQA